MSVLSKFLKKSLGIPEVNLLEVPFVNTLIATATSNKLAATLPQLNDTQFLLLYVAVSNEKARRESLPVQ